MECIPIVDLGSITNRKIRDTSQFDADAELIAISKEIDNVLESIGFVYIRNHGISSDIIQNAFLKSKEFFKMDQQKKRKYLKGKDHLHGYVEPNQEMLEPGKYDAELRESFDISINARNDLKQKDIVQDTPGFVNGLTDLADACVPLIETIFRILGYALKLEDTEFVNKCSKAFKDTKIPSFTTLRTIYYPPIGNDVKPGTTRCAPHSDYGTITILFQDDMGGLEVQRADGKWVPATPIPDTILVNVGDLLSVWSNGRYPATLHRVLIPEIEIKKKSSRQSIVYFLHPDDDIIISPLNPNETESSKKFKPVKSGDHTKGRLAASYKY